MARPTCAIWQFCRHDSLKAKPARIKMNEIEDQSKAADKALGSRTYSL